jgi:LAGLIDADG DNA endonuclease family protein
MTLAVLKLGYMLEHPSSRAIEEVKNLALLSLSDNASSADNQQGRPQMQEVDVETGNYLSGFADGEGCFYVGVHPTSNVSLGLQVVPEFHVSQNGERISVLPLFLEALGCGVIKRNAATGSSDRTYVLVVKRHRDLHERVVPFFERFPLRSEKQQEFLKFAEVVEMMHRKNHLTSAGLKRILELAFSMNGSKFRKHRLTTLLQNLEPSETICQVPASQVKI